MKKNKVILVAALSAVLIGISACGYVSSDQPSAKDESVSDSASQSKSISNNEGQKNASQVNDSKNQSSDKSSGNDGGNNENHSQAGQSSDSSEEKASNNNETDVVTDAVIKATLDYESQKPFTTVDYHSKTMTQSGQKVGFEIVASTDHQDDFKVGTVKEKNDNEVNHVTLYQYKVDENSQLSLIDPSYDSVVYATYISDSPIQLSSGDAAVQYLKQQIKEGSSGDFSFGATEAPETDDIGAYYTVEVINIPLRAAGKTGTSYYKVYQDGIFMTI